MLSRQAFEDSIKQFGSRRRGERRIIKSPIALVDALVSEAAENGGNVNWNPIERVDVHSESSWSPADIGSLRNFLDSELVRTVDAVESIHTLIVTSSARSATERASVEFSFVSFGNDGVHNVLELSVGGSTSSSEIHTSQPATIPPSVLSVVFNKSVNSWTLTRLVLDFKSATPVHTDTGSTVEDDQQTEEAQQWSDFLGRTCNLEELYVRGWSDTTLSRVFSLVPPTALRSLKLLYLLQVSFSTSEFAQALRTRLEGNEEMTEHTSFRVIFVECRSSRDDMRRQIEKLTVSGYEVSWDGKLAIEEVRAKI